MQEIRLQVIAQLLRIREENRQKMNAKRLDRRWNRRQKEKSEIAKKVRTEYASGNMRSLERNYYYRVMIACWCCSYSKDALRYGARA